MGSAEQAPPGDEKPAPQKKPKRLTLQERLALAAKKKKAHDPAPVSEPDSVSATPEPPATPEPIEREKTVEPEEIGGSDETGEKKESEKKEPEDVGEEPKESEKAVEPPNELQLQVDSLQREIKKLKEEALSAKLRAPPADNDRKLAEKDKLIQAHEKKLAEKETTIQQLMEEGQQLSKKELKQNERIRTLVASNTKLEASLKDYAEKNQESLLKLGEIEDLMKTHKLKSVDELLETVSASQQKIAELQQTINRFQENNWDGKYRESQRLYEREVEEKSQCRKELDEALVHLDLLKNQQKLELASKEKIITKLNRDLMAVKDENSTEISRLESKIESLRIENESFLKYAQKPQDDTNGSKMVDYKDYAKLSETHQYLQAQYVSSQENWKTIESNLLNKVDSLTSSADSLKKNKLKLSGEIRNLHSQLNAQADKIEQLEEQIKALTEERKQLQFQLQVKGNENSDLEEKAEELKAVFNTQRQNYELKIKSLTETVQKLEAPAYPSSVSADNLNSLQTKRGFRESGLNLSLDFRTPHRKFSYNSLTNNSATNTPASIWEEPMDHSRRNSMFELPDSTSLNDEIYPQDASDYREASVTTPTGAGSGATKNIQLINKMSSNIRRLEVEIMTLKEENEHLSLEKEAAQQEIVNMSNMSARVGELEKQIEQLQQEVAEKQRKEDTLLEVIGEKSERVGELQADVADLKDLLRSQVQQMIEMSGK